MTFLLQHCSRICQPLLMMSRRCSFLTADKPIVVDKAKLKQAEEIIRRARCLYRPEEFMLCFNGGKDCTVLLDLLAQQRKGTELLHAFCVRSYEPFLEVEQFIDKSIQRYPMVLNRYDGSLKLAIEQALSEQPQVRAMFLGNRRSDPGCAELSEMTASDKDWPPLMRIFPLIEWSYHDIWNYLRSRQITYCSLYDQGYTSLGERNSTQKNPSLLVWDERLDRLIYRPAYELRDEKLERANREDALIKLKIPTKSMFKAKI